MQKTARTGLSITTRVTEVSSAIRTIDQLGGQGDVFNRSLAIPGHLRSYGSPLRSLEYVIMAPTSTSANPTSIGEHTQATDEIYFMITGERARIITNGHVDLVAPGDLVIAPKGTTHGIENLTDVALGFLVVEVAALNSLYKPTIIRDLPKKLQPTSTFLPASVPLRVTSVNLNAFFSGLWGDLSLLEIPAGGRIHAHTEKQDQIILIVGGNATLLIEQERENAEGFGLSAFVPAGVEHGLINQSSRNPLLVVVVNLPHVSYRTRHSSKWTKEIDHA